MRGEIPALDFRLSNDPEHLQRAARAGRPYSGNGFAPELKATQQRKPEPRKPSRKPNARTA